MPPGIAPRSQRRLHLLLLAALLAAAGPLPARGSSTAARITDVAWAPEGRVGKILIHLDGPVRYRTVASPSSIVTDLWEAHLQSWAPLRVAHPYVTGVRVNQITDDLARIRIDLWQPARYKTFVRDNPYELAVVVIPPSMATSPLPDSVAYEKRRVRTGSRATTVHVLRVNPADPALEIRPVLSADMIAGSEATSIIATRFDAAAGINGGYYMEAGDPIGMMMVDGELVSAPLPRRSVFGISRSGVPFIESFTFRGRAILEEGAELPITAVNQAPPPGGVAIYTPQYGPLTPPLAIGAVIRRGVSMGVMSGRILIPRDGHVLAVREGDAALLTRHLRAGKRVVVSVSVWPDMDVQNALGGGPRLVKDGRVLIPYAWEWFDPRLANQREPRTAVGITSGGKVLLVTVDGRSRTNAGMTLQELAELMVDLGAREAMNLDGGGSATMVVGGRVVNDPSDGFERPIASALLILSHSDTAGVAPKTSPTSPPRLSGP